MRRRPPESSAEGGTPGADSMVGPASPPAITSPANPRLRAIGRLRDRHERDTRGLTLVDGAREVVRVLEAGADVREILLAPTLVRSPGAVDALAAIEAARLPVTHLSEAAFGRIAYGDRTDGILAVVATPSAELDDLRLPDDPLVVVLESVEKPGNVGAVLRSADGAGVDAVILVDTRADPWNPNTIRASVGTVFSLPIGVASGEATRAWLRARGVRMAAALVEARAPYTAADLTGPLAIVLGSEAEGLSEAWSTPDVTAVRIPMLGRADSLNVSVAAAVLLYEARRQRDRAG